MCDISFFAEPSPLNGVFETTVEGRLHFPSLTPINITQQQQQLKFTLSENRKNLDLIRECFTSIKENKSSCHHPEGNYQNMNLCSVQYEAGLRSDVSYSSDDSSCLPSRNDKLATNDESYDLLNNIANCEENAFYKERSCNSSPLLVNPCSPAAPKKINYAKKLVCINYNPLPQQMILQQQNFILENNQYQYYNTENLSLDNIQQQQQPMAQSPKKSLFWGNPSSMSELELLEMTIKPIDLNFLPKELWVTNHSTIKFVFQNFFKARSTKNLRFEHKLWNALVLTKSYPDLISYIGVYWVSCDILKVHRDIFGKLINVTKPAAALFNNQGSFITHGFVEVSRIEAIKCGILPEYVDDVDESIVRLYKHGSRLLTANSHKNVIALCKWNK